ncbi:hypothetical protein LJC11_03210 [Bacteroidales bacterium OttesenSCG-928-I21]|nr:hypothetical protein [Bacteroidales bacterium OttesenSCG-928-I21]
MSAIIITSDNDSNLKIMLELAKRLKLKTRKINIEDIEDAGLYYAIKEGEKTPPVSTDAVIKKLKSKLKK